MRLSYMYQTLVDAYNGLSEVKFSRQTVARENYIVINNYPLMYDILTTLNTLNMFTQDIKTIKDSFFLVSQVSDDEYRINAERGNTIINCIENVKRELDLITDFLEKIGIGDEYVGFDVKMPPTDDFTEFVGYINDFQKLVLSCPCLQNKDEKIILKCADLGSIWMCFAIAGAGTVILTNLAKLIDKAVKTKSHIITCEQQKEQLIAMKQKNKLAEQILKIYDDYKDSMVSQYADELATLPEQQKMLSSDNDKSA